MPMRSSDAVRWDFLYISFSLPGMNIVVAALLPYWAFSVKVLVTPKMAVGKCRPVRQALLVADSVEFLQYFLLPPVEVCGDGHDGFDDLIAPAETAEMGDAFPFQAEDLAALGAPGDFQLFRSRERWHLDAVPQGRLNEGYGHPADDVVIGSLEEFVFLHMDEDIQIAVGPRIPPVPLPPGAGGGNRSRPRQVSLSARFS